MLCKLANGDTPALGKSLRRDAGSLGWKWGETRYQVLRYLIPVGYGTVTYAVIWLTGLGGLYDKQFVSTAHLLTFCLVRVVALIPASLVPKLAN